jgi:hypothetical protein
MPRKPKPAPKKHTKATDEGLKPETVSAPTAGVRYSDELANEICAWIADGKSLRAFCRQPKTPDVVNVYRWLAKNEEFRDQYARAREDQADSHADQIIEIADTEEDPNKARIRIDARKWVASKLKPKKYGDKLGLSGDGDGAPIQHQVGVQWMTEQQAKDRGWA